MHELNVLRREEGQVHALKLADPVQGPNTCRTVKVGSWDSLVVLPCGTAEGHVMSCDTLLHDPSPV